MKSFRVEAVAQTEFDDAAGWYETQRSKLGFELIEEIDRVLRATGEVRYGPIATIENGVVRRELVERFVSLRRLVCRDERVMFRRASSDPMRWKSRIISFL